MLSLLGLIAGLFSELIGRQLIAPAVSAVRAEETLVRLQLWHGISPVLMLSAATLLTGIGLFIARHPLRRFAKRLRSLAIIGPEQIYRSLFDLVLKFAGWQTRVIQNGYHSIYLLVIAAAALLLILVNFSWSGISLDRISLTDVRYDEVLLVVIMLISGISVIKMRSRLGGVIALGVLGYSIAMLYVLYGAPDLAITQILVETLTVILFVFVIYHLPRFTGLSSRTNRIRDGIIAVLFGGTMTMLMLKAITMPHTPISTFFAQNSYLQAFGRNVVNVILVDFRSLDTLGEITVLSVAALGVFAMLKLRSKNGKQL
jgi:multicomponent Na+:H+ antiporter subunit A